MYIYVCARPDVCISLYNICLYVTTLLTWLAFKISIIHFLKMHNAHFFSSYICKKIVLSCNIYLKLISGTGPLEIQREASPFVVIHVYSYDRKQMRASTATSRKMFGHWPTTVAFTSCASRISQLEKETIRMKM
jgi:hypothetical protein